MSSPRCPICDKRTAYKFKMVMHIMGAHGFVRYEHFLKHCWCGYKCQELEMYKHWLDREGGAEAHAREALVLGYEGWSKL